MRSCAGDRLVAPTPHVALLAFPFASHPGSLYALARAIAAAAPGAAFSFLSSARSLTALSPPATGNLRLCAVDVGSPSPAASIEEQIELFQAAAPGNLRDAVAAAVEGTGGAAVTCVVSHAFVWMAAGLAEELGVPWVPVWTGGSTSLVAHIHTDLLRRSIGVGDQALPGRADETLNFIPGLTGMRVRDLPEGVVFDDLESCFSLLLHRMGKELHRGAALVLNSFEGLDPAIDAAFKAMFKEYLPVGPIKLLTSSPSEPDDAAGCLPWLDRQRPATVAYVSFGTARSLPPGELAELAEGLEASGIPFLWSLNERLREHLPAGFLDRTRGQGLVVAWAPQVQVLGHPAVGAFVVHSGWNSVLESISTGVPMVCRPLFADNRMNARMVSNVLRIGVGFESGVVTRDAAARALNIVLREEEGKKMRERIRELKAKAMGVVGPDGSSTKNFSRLLQIVCRC